MIGRADAILIAAVWESVEEDLIDESEAAGLLAALGQHPTAARVYVHFKRVEKLYAEEHALLAKFAKQPESVLDELTAVEQKLNEANFALFIALRTAFAPMVIPS